MSLTQYQIHTEPVSLNPETVTEDRWHQPWSEPVRVRIAKGLAIALAASGCVFAQPPLVSGPENWCRELSRPVQHSTPWKTASNPVDFIAVRGAETITPDKWIYPWSEPVRLRRGLAAQLQQFNPTPPIVETITEDKWSYQWSNPIQYSTPWKTAANPVDFIAVSAAETITADKWAYPWSEPVRSKRGLATQHQQFSALCLATFNETVTWDRWGYPWSNPIQYSTPWKTAANPVDFIAVASAAAEVITEDKWGYPWSTPIQLSMPWTTAGAPVDFAAIENITEDKWHFPWSNPIQLSTPWKTATNPVDFIAVTAAPAEVITEDKWGYPWSEPVRVHRGLHASLQQSFVINPTTPPTEVITEDKWGYPWSRPIQHSIPWKTGANPVDFAGFEAVTEDRWHQPWSEPVRQRQGLHASRQQFFAVDPKIPTVFTNWFNPLSEPVRVRQRDAWFQFYTTDTTAIPTSKGMGWFAGLAEPVRIKRPDAWFQFYTNDTAAIPVSQLFWFAPLSDPVRLKPGLRTWLQQTTSLATPVQPNPAFLLEGWYNWLGEPVRLPKGLKAWHQQFLAYPPRLIFGPVFVTMAAIEINLDMAQFDITTYNAATNARVSIVEIPAIRHGAASIEG